MKEKNRTIAVTAAKTAFFVACVTVVVIGQKTVGWGSLALMLAGLAGLLALLWSYNRRFK